MALTYAARNQYYGPPGGVPVRYVTTPWGMRACVHPLVADVFLEACREAHRLCSWRPQRIDSYNPRPIRGSTKPSMHGYALAWDFFATPPNVAPPGGVWTPNNGLPADFARCFTRRGFTWGAYWTRKDIPHIEWAGPPPRGPVVAADSPPERTFLDMLDAQKQQSVYDRSLWAHQETQALHQRVNQLEAKLDTVLARQEEAKVHGYNLRDSLAALTRRLFGVDEKAKNDHEPFWVRDSPVEGS